MTGHAIGALSGELCGNESTAPVASASNNTDLATSRARALRHRLEAFHGKSNGDLDLILANIGNEDRFLRYAARVALESQPIAKWRGRAFEAQGKMAIISAMMAVAHQGSLKMSIRWWRSSRRSTMPP